MSAETEHLSREARIQLAEVIEIQGLSYADAIKEMELRAELAGAPYQEAAAELRKARGRGVAA